jgi:hypothetical protein
MNPEPSCGSIFHSSAGAATNRYGAAASGNMADAEPCCRANMKQLNSRESVLIEKQCG